MLCKHFIKLINTAYSTISKDHGTCKSRTQLNFDRIANSKTTKKTYTRTKSIWNGNWYNKEKNKNAIAKTRF
jgi:hypothetical protein